MIKSKILHLPSLNWAPSLTSSKGLSHTRFLRDLSLVLKSSPLGNSFSPFQTWPESIPARDHLRTPTLPGASKGQRPFSSPFLVSPASGEVITGSKTHFQNPFLWEWQKGPQQIVEGQRGTKRSPIARDGDRESRLLLSCKITRPFLPTYHLTDPVSHGGNPVSRGCNSGHQDDEK